MQTVHWRCTAAGTVTMDDNTFSGIVEQYTDYAYNIAFRMLHNPSDAEDAVQDAFLSAYRARDRFRGDAAVTTWLYRIVVNAVLMKVRKERRPGDLQQSNIDDVELVDWSPGPESATLNAELKAQLEEALSRLPEDLRVAVVLRDVQELSNEEAAQVLEISVPAFKARLHRGRVLLRGHLSSYIRTPKA